MLAVQTLDPHRPIACPAEQPDTQVRATVEVSFVDWTDTATEYGCGGAAWGPAARDRGRASPPIDVDAPPDAGSIARFMPTGLAPKSDIGDDDPGFDDRRSIDTSFEIALLSDYRRGGLTRSGGDPALQVTLDIEEPSGWSVGISATTIEERKGANVEVDLYGAKSFEFGDTELTLGASALIFPGGEHLNFGIARASLSRPFGPIDLTLAVNYAWEQANLDHEDNLYVVLRARSPVGRLLGAPLTAGASVGRAEGHMAIEGVKVDWSLSLTADVHGTDIGLSYVDTDLDDERGDATCVLSIVRTF